MKTSNHLKNCVSVNRDCQKWETEKVTEEMTVTFDDKCVLF